MTNRVKATFLGSALIVVFILLLSQAAWTTAEADYMEAYTGAEATMIGTATCLMCHADQKSEEGDHVAILNDDENGCEKCHGPGSKHNGDVKGILNPSMMPQDDVTATCSSCHDDQGKYKETEWVESTHHEGGLKCTDCHSGHSDNDHFLVKDNVGDLCKTCHEDICALVEAGDHGAPDTACNMCHNPHNN